MNPPREFACHARVAAHIVHHRSTGYLGVVNHKPLPSGLTAMESMACLNGELMPADQARVPVLDRGFLFGDGVYEVFRLYRGRGWIEDGHRARLARSLWEMQLTGVDMDGLAERIKLAVSASGIAEGMVYIQITRGVGPRRHAFPDPGTKPTELILVIP